MLLSLLLACAAEAPVPTAAPAAPAPAAPAPAEVCADPATVYFQCPTRDGQSITVCANREEPRWVRYRYGTAAKAELVFPEQEAGSADRFVSEERTYVSSSGNVLRFENGGYTYEVTEMAGAGGANGEENNFAGVRVLKGEEQVSAIPCSAPPVSRWQDLDFIVHPPSP